MFIYKKKILFRLSHSELPLAIVGKNTDNKMIKQQPEDWADVQLRSIAEILVAFEVIFLIFQSFLSFNVLMFSVNVIRFRIARLSVQLSQLTLTGAGSTFNVISAINVSLELPRVILQS